MLLPASGMMAPHRKASPLSSIAPQRARAGALAAVVAALLAHGATAFAAEVVAAPGSTEPIPKHAAGGWPTETTGDDKRPGRTPEQQAAIDEVASELRRIASKFGPDSVVLQSKLLIRSMAAGAVGPTEVRVAGPSTGDAGPGHLEIDIETGLFFDEKTTTADSRRDTVWKEVAAPVLDEMVSFHIEPEALELVFLFDVQQFASETPDLSAESRHEAFRARLAREVLEDLMSDKVTGDAMREKVIFTPAVTVARPVAQADPAPR